MNWPIFVALSALSLGVYDVSRKHAVKGNSVVEVLLVSSLAGLAAFLAVSGLSGGLPAAADVPWRVRALLGVKVLLVGAGWGSIYCAMRRLPISLAAPIRSAAPFWTVLGAMALFQEIPSWGRAAGMALMLSGFLGLAALGSREGFPLWSRETGLMLLGTLFGASSGLYDKYLLSRAGLPAPTVQLYFSAGMVILYGCVWAVRRMVWRAGERSPFVWRWTIPAVGVLLVLSDWFYFRALSRPEAPVSVVAVFRRTSTVVAFFLGGTLFHDLNLRAKLIPLALVLAGAVLTALC